MYITVYQTLYSPAGAGRPAWHICLAKEHQSNLKNMSKHTKTYKIIK